MRNQYLVMTINVLGLYESADIVGKNGDSSYLIDLSSGYPSYITNEIRYDSALFYQICRLLYGTDRNKIKRLDAIRKSILIFDYSEMFKELYMKNSNPADIIAAIDSENSHDSIEYHLGRLLNPDVGIKIKYSNNDTRTYVPFDKSSSMAKQCRISYIDQTIKTDLDNRLCLDIDFTHISMQLSKYYAYRGLYLTTGTRIPRSDQFCLNEDTVIVIPDLITRPTADFNGKPLLFRQIISGEDGKLKFDEVKKYKDSNVFDGEGLISPAFSSYIQNFTDKDAYSFQIRMPFIKGVLHTADFHSFLKNDTGLNEYTITDIFNKERDLCKAHIILTKSMFKCAGWLKTYWESMSISKRSHDYDNDPMRFYFKTAVGKYNHTLYVSGSDASFKPNGYEQVNYQYLDTLKISPENFNKLISQHFEIGEELIKNTYNPCNKSKDDESTNSLRPYVAAALKNPAFYSEPQLKAEIFQLLRNLRVDCGMGSLWSTGEHRYLSGDLMAFFWYLKRLVDKNHGVKNSTTDAKYFKNLKKTILRNQFYMPEGTGINPSQDEYCALFRSPHLSRNEECIMKPYIPDSDNDPYSKYFGKLKGVIMTPTDSLVDLLESGADHDGDFLHIYSDPIIVNAVKSGCYSDDYKRVLSIVDIPSSDSVETTPTSSTDFVKLIINTFSNYTGLISNLSVVFADKQYNFFSEETNPEDSHCPKTTIVAGLEIDSTKHGAHPIKSIEQLQELSKKFSVNGIYFTNCKDTFKKMRGFNYKRAYRMKEKDETTEKANPDYCLRYKPGEKGIIFRFPNEKSHNLIRLTYAFAEKDASSHDSIKYLIDNSFIPEYSEDAVKFKFEEDEHWKDDLDPHIIKKVSSLSKCYSKLVLAANKYRQLVLRNSKTYSKLYNLIQLKYDRRDAPINKDYITTCNDAMDEAIELVAEHIDSEKMAEDIFNEYDTKWMYQPRDNRVNALCDILNIENPDEIPQHIIDLVTDFSFDGYYILYYMIELALESLKAKLKKEDIIERYISKTKEDPFNYYQDLLDTYKGCANYRINLDQYTSEVIDDYEANNYEHNNTHPYWKDELIEKARELLSAIFAESKESDTDFSNLLLLKYVHYVRIEEDKWGTFFWDVMQKEIILNNVMEVG